MAVGGASRSPEFVTSSYMPGGPGVATSLCIVAHAKQDLSYFCMWECCLFLKRLAHLSGQLANACLEDKGIGLHCSNAKLLFWKEAAYTCCSAQMPSGKDKLAMFQQHSTCECMGCYTRKQGVGTVTESRLKDSTEYSRQHEGVVQGAHWK